MSAIAIVEQILSILIVGSVLAFGLFTYLAIKELWGRRK